MGKLMAAAAYSAGRRVADIAVADGRAWAEKPDHFVWIGIHGPDPADLRELQHQFGLHELAIEDALELHQRPKIEAYGDGIFIVMRTVHQGDQVPVFGETHLFAGKGYVISVRHGGSKSYAQVRARCESAPQFLRHGEDYVIHAILDFIVDNFSPVVEAVENEVTEIEHRVLREPLTRAEIERIHELRRQLRYMRSAVAPTAEICNRLQHLDVDFIQEPIRPYFRDVADHVAIVAEQIGSLREALDHAFDAGLLLEQAREGEVNRKIAGWAAIFAVPTAVAGIYGMNFKDMPELDWRFGYPVTLVGMILLCGLLYWRFRRSGWL